MSITRCTQSRLNGLKSLLAIAILSLAFTTIYIDNNNQSQKTPLDVSDELPARYLKKITDAPPTKDIPIEVDQDVLLYNRVPKTGSRSLVMIMKALGQRNDFNFSRSKPPFQSKLNDSEQGTFVLKILNMTRPSAYERHVHFVDFCRFGSPSPIYINLIRDPIERFLSFFYFHQEERVGKRRVAPDEYKMIDDCIKSNESVCNDTSVFFRTVTFFCGQGPMCSIPSEEALQRAKNNVLKYYKVVGILEEFSLTLKALEIFLPSYFRGARSYYSEHKSELKRMFKTKQKFYPSPRAAVLLRAKLVYEYDFYNFIKSRLFAQLAKKRAALKN